MKYTNTKNNNINPFKLSATINSSAYELYEKLGYKENKLVVMERVLS